MSHLQPQPLRVTLVDWPRYPLETLYYVWQQSKHNGMMLPPDQIDMLLHTDTRDADCLPDDVCAFLVTNTPTPSGPTTWATVLKLWKRDFYAKVAYLFDEAVPCGQNLEFIFQLENVPVAFREQLVRHKVGSKVDDRIGFDTVPDVAESAFWAQSHRVLDMGRFYDEGQWYQPSSIDDTPVTLQYRDPLGGSHTLPHQPMTRSEVYMSTLRMCQEAYSQLVTSGVPEEEARNVLPFAVTHRMTWKVNLVSMKYIIGKRSCWIMQRGFWESLIQQAVDEMVEMIHPMFRRLVNPPCIHGKNGWKGCPVKLSNIDRISGKDPNPPCPLFLNHHREDALIAADDPNAVWGELSQGNWVTGNEKRIAAMGESRRLFRDFWQRDVDTGEPITNQPVVAVDSNDTV